MALPQGLDPTLLAPHGPGPACPSCAQTLLSSCLWLNPIFPAHAGPAPVGTRQTAWGAQAVGPGMAAAAARRSCWCWEVSGYRSSPALCLRAEGLGTHVMVPATPCIWAGWD